MAQHDHLKGETYVYVLACAGKCKIGIARDTFTRIAHMQMHCPMPITLTGERKFASRDEARMVERDLHAQFAERRLWGEWFDVDPDTARGALTEHEGTALPVSFQQAPRHPDLMPKDRPREPMRAPALPPLVPTQPTADWVVLEGERATWEELEAMPDDQWVEYMRPIYASLDYSA